MRASGRPGRTALIAALVALAFYLPGLGGFDLLGDDAILDAGIARDVAENGNWLYPTFNGEMIPKPPLFYWIAAVSMTLAGGFSEFAVRLPSALAAAGTVALTAGLGAAFVGLRAATVGALLFAVMPVVWDQARISRADATMTLLVTAALLLWLRDPASLAGRRRVGFFALVGLAGLTKGAAGPGLVGVIVLAEVAFGSRWAALRPLLHPAALLAVAIPGGWYLAGALHWGEEFVSAHLLGENLRHFVGGGWVSDAGAGGEGDAWKHVRNLFTGAMPWGLLLPAALVSLAGDTGERDLVPARRLARWVLAGLLFFSVAARKSPYYLLPLFPAVALLVARWLTQRTPRFDLGLDGLGGRFRLGAAALVLALAGAAVFVAAFAPVPREIAGFVTALREGPVFVLAMVTGIAVLVPGTLESLRAGDSSRAVPRLWLVVFLVFLLAGRIEAVLARDETMRPFARIVRETVGHDPEIYFFQQPTRSIAFYANLRIRTLRAEDELPREPFWLIVRPPFLEELPGEWRQRAQVVASAEGRAVTRTRMRVDLLRVGSLDPRDSST